MRREKKKKKGTRSGLLKIPNIVKQLSTKNVKLGLTVDRYVPYKNHFVHRISLHAN